jgi:Flp pilus assembly protein TadB
MSEIVVALLPFAVCVALYLVAPLWRDAGRDE